MRPFTTENILRALLVHVIEGDAWRGTAVRISESPFLQDFIRLGNRNPMDYSFLNRCFKVIEPETWKEVNDWLGAYGVEEGKVSPDVIRTDTTVIESNIHYPTDSSLLWDSYRVLVRLIRRVRELRPALCSHRFHDKKVKKLYLFICRYIKSPSKHRQRTVRAKFQDLLNHVHRLIGIVEALLPEMEADALLQAIMESMKEYLPAVKNVAHVAERVQLLGEKVSANEKTYSIFEQHVELLKRGKSGKPVEFGHKVLVTQSEEKFITNYDVLEKQKPDSKLTEKVVEEHKEQFGSYPKVVAGDKGFRDEAEKMKELEGKVEFLAIPKKATDWGKTEFQPWQPFRAGVEGSISVLKRGFRLLRCFYRGFKSFAASIGLAVFAHNLIQLTGVWKE